MDGRIRRRIEYVTGLPFETFPNEGVKVVVSDARSERPKNRLLVQRVMGKNGVLVTGTPRILKDISRWLNTMTSWEIFSPLGIAEMKRRLSPDDSAALDEDYGLDYYLSEREEFLPFESGHTVTTLTTKDIPPSQYQLRLSERRTIEAGDFTWAFACFSQESPPATRLSLFGSHCASIAIVIWENDVLAGFGVETEESLWGRGHGLAVVSAATKWVLDQEAVAWYGAYSNNIASLRIARRLGFSLGSSSIRA
jgi:RimJ/RimL family protein N-acetyltransferase